MFQQDIDPRPYYRKINLGAHKRDPHYREATNKELIITEDVSEL